MTNRKVLISTNLEIKAYGLKRGTMNPALQAMVYNFRKFIHELGYDCSLMLDHEILAFEEEIHLAETDNDNTTLIEILDFLSRK